MTRFQQFEQRIYGSLDRRKFAKESRREVDRLDFLAQMDGVIVAHIERLPFMQGKGLMTSCLPDSMKTALEVGQHAVLVDQDQHSSQTSVFQFVASIAF